ncbi:MAG: polymer-forming cytoskeletal protein [Lachnospiraceae bacterium]|nr:polymer-forming cytoskeletal protein [Lachnospiraceae bacterium]
MSFFKDFKEDLLQAADELISSEEKDTVESMEVLEDVSEEEEIEVAVEESTSALDEEEIAEVIEEAVEEAVEEIIVKEEKKMEEKIEVNVETEENEVNAEVTTISKGVHLEGNLRAEGSVNLLGSVVGDLECDGKLVIDGTIKGNAKAAEIYANGARVEGDIMSEGSLKVGSGSVIIGNVVASSAVIGGAIKGDIDVKGPVIVDSTAVVYGNIKSRSVQLNNGAVLEGHVSQCYAGVDVKALFEEKAAKKEDKSKK